MSTETTQPELNVLGPHIQLILVQFFLPTNYPIPDYVNRVEENPQPLVTKTLDELMEDLTKPPTAVPTAVKEKGVEIIPSRPNFNAFGLLLKIEENGFIMVGCYSKPKNTQRQMVRFTFARIENQRESQYFGPVESMRCTNFMLELENAGLFTAQVYNNPHFENQQPTGSRTFCFDLMLQEFGAYTSMPQEFQFEDGKITA